MSPASACDRCHSIKARCIPSNVFAGCCRCSRLQHRCSYSRTQGLPGRKKKQYSKGNSTLVKREYHWVKVEPAPKDVHQRKADQRVGDKCKLHRVTSYSLSGSVTLEVLLEEDKMTDFYAVTSSFASRLKATVRANLCTGPPLLRDLYMTVMRIFQSPSADQAVYGVADISLGAMGLQVLRHTKINDETSLASFLWLGIFLMTFDRLILGTSTYLICENVLSQLSTCHPWASSDPKISDAVICMLFTDSVTCLLNCRVPIIRFEPPRSGLPDRYAGLCSELLPILYDTCMLVVSSATDASSLNLDSWTKVYQRVRQWQPQCAPDMLNTLASDELAVLLSQAHSYGVAVILILHRIRHPSESTQTDAQIQYADEILSQMGNCLAMTGEPPPHTIMPILIAALELKDPGKRAQALHILQACRGVKKYSYTTLLGKICHGFWSQDSPDWVTFLRRYHPLNIPL